MMRVRSTVFAPTILALCSTLAMSACSSKPAPDLYVLRADDTQSARRCTPGDALTIARPTSRAEYDSKRVAILLGDNHLTYYTGAGWASPLPDQLQDFLIDSLTQANLFTTVQSDAEDANSGTSLTITIHEADVIHIDAPVARLRMTAVVRDVASGHITARVHINESIPAAQNHMADIVAAFDQAATNATQKIIKAMKPRCSPAE